MMDEKIFSGYCRTLDQSRMVTAEKEDGQWFVDCSYENCPFADQCTIAQAIREL